MKDKKKILIVDDDDGIRECIIRILAKENKYHLEIATNGLEAEEKIERIHPDLVILDIKIPQKDGYAICMHIRETLKMHNIKIIGMSGISGGIGEAFMTTLGADHYFKKPFSVMDFRKRVSELLNEKE